MSAAAGRLAPVKFFSVDELRALAGAALVEVTKTLRPGCDFPFTLPEVLSHLWLCHGWQHGGLNVARPLKEKRSYALRIAVREVDRMYRDYLGGGMVPPEPAKVRDSEALARDRSTVIAALRHTVPIGQVVDNRVRTDPDTGMVRDRVLERCPIIRALDRGESIAQIRASLAQAIGCAVYDRRRFLAALHDECAEYERLTGDTEVWARVLPIVSQLRGRRGPYKKTQTG